MGFQVFIMLNKIFLLLIPILRRDQDSVLCGGREQGQGGPRRGAGGGGRDDQGGGDVSQ